MPHILQIAFQTDFLEKHVLTKVLLHLPPDRIMFKQKTNETQKYKFLTNAE